MLHNSPPCVASKGDLSTNSSQSYTSFLDNGNLKDPGWLYRVGTAQVEPRLVVVQDHSFRDARIRHAALQPMRRERSGVDGGTKLAPNPVVPGLRGSPGGLHQLLFSAHPQPSSDPYRHL